MSEITPRFAIPNIMVSQAHKEITHNEALAIIDGLLHLSVIDSASSPPTLTISDAGKCWLVVAPGSGAWTGKENRLASWNGSGWRFVEPVEGMAIWNSQNNSELRFSGSEWRQPGVVLAPAGGSVVDLEARAAFSLLLTHLRNAGILAN